ncbi:MAG: polysulfide reductase, partial [Adlercreutzia equolifaciens]
MADAGRPERVISLWLSPRFTVMTVGAWALLASSVLAAFFSFVSNGAGARLPLFVVLAAAIAAVIAGVATAIYTGVLLTLLPSVIAFGTWL